MNWNFFKTNWFTIALVTLLLLAAIGQGSGKFSLGNFSTFDTKQPGELIPIKKSATALGIGADPKHSPAAPAEVDQATATAFLKRFAPVAVSERKKFGVPASVMLSIAFLNSHIGLNDAALEANNFFALPCTQEWEGESISLEERCVRKYETPWASWRDFSIHFSSQDWYGGLRKSAGKDWQKWASGLQDKDISPISNLPKKMAEVITYYRLYELDQP
jgi:flagellum-specific peptidoglycan hydrolase FlgJ